MVYTSTCILPVPPKPVLWVGTSLDDLRALPAAARRELGFDLRRVQVGLLPRDWKTMPSIGSGVMEVRVRLGGAFRMIFVAKFTEGVYVLHVFQKRTRRTSTLDVTVARARLALVQRARKERA